MAVEVRGLIRASIVARAGMKRIVGIGAMLFACPSYALASTPPGSVRSPAAKTQYPTATACRAALDTWVNAQRKEQQRDPVSEPDSWVMSGPNVGPSDEVSYRVTRIVRTRLEGNLHTVAYVYERSCDGAVHSSISDGWVDDQTLPPTLEKN